MVREMWDGAMSPSFFLSSRSLSDSVVTSMDVRGNFYFPWILSAHSMVCFCATSFRSMSPTTHTALIGGRDRGTSGL
jgi:hypothetical protein